MAMAPVASPYPAARASSEDPAMTAHLPIQEPDDYSPTDLMRMAEVLFSALTSVEELERTCMTLAHLPTEDAQDLLARFRDSPRGREIGWLQCAIDEGTFHFLTPQNAIEEREYLTLEVIQELIEEACDLEVELGQTRTARDKAEIRLSALRTLADAKRIHQAEVEGFRGGILCDTNRIEELEQEIELKEAMIEQ